MFQLCCLVSVVFFGLGVWGAVKFESIHEEFVVGAMSVFAAAAFVSAVLSACAACAQMRFARTVEQTMPTT